MYAALLGMVEEGFIQTEEARRMAIPTVGRSRTDFLAPFSQDGFFAGLSMEQIEVFPGETESGRSSKVAATPERSVPDGLPSRALLSSQP